MCKSENLTLVLDLGNQPHSDWFPTQEELSSPEIRYPLRLVSCQNCGLLQIDYFVNPVTLYQQDYLYQSSTTATGRDHYKKAARQICDAGSVQEESLVVDIGSNVGVLLQGFKDMGMQVLGVDPSPVASAEATNNGIETLVDFFTEAVADTILATKGEAAVITGTNVFAHLHDIDSAVKGMKKLLGSKGVLVIEAPHAQSLIENVEYDTIYHQHIGYLSVRPMISYLAKMGLELFHVEKLSIHGGSLRYYVGHPSDHKITEEVQKILDEEVISGIYSLNVLSQFAEKTAKQKKDLLELLVRLKKEGKRVVAISTPAKGNTLLNYCQLGTHLIEYATEKNALKIGRYTPGSRIPIKSDAHLIEDAPDYAIILAWNFSEEIMAQMTEFANGGGRFIIPIPTPKIT